MNRRSIFKSLTAAIVASSMEVMGWSAPEIKTPRQLYEDAAYEEVIIYHPAVVGLALIVNKGDQIPEGRPTGRRHDNKDGKWIVRDYYEP